MKNIKEVMKIIDIGSVVEYVPHDEMDNNIYKGTITDIENCYWKNVATDNRESESFCLICPGKIVINHHHYLDCIHYSHSWSKYHLTNEGSIIRDIVEDTYQLSEDLFII